MNMLVTGIALLVASGTFLAFELSAFRSNMVRNLSVQAQIGGSNSASALLFDDAQSAAQTLSALNASPNIVFAGVYTPSGQSFASYFRDPGAVAPPLPPLPGGKKETWWFSSDYLSLERQIVFQGKFIGSIYIRSDLRQLSDQLLRYWGIFGGVFILSLVCAFGLSTPFQRALARPIVQLAEVARTVSRQKEYSIRAAPARGHDEVAVLIDAFNEMLSEIQSRDAALEVAHERLNLALRSASIGTWSVGDGVISFDDFMYPLFGLAPGAFSGDYAELVNLIHPGDRKLIQRTVENALSAGINDPRQDFYDIEFRTVRPDGAVRTLTARGKIYRDNTGRPVRMTGVCWDISSRKESEEERRKFVSLVEQTDDFVAMAGLDKKITYMNQAGLLLVGLAPDTAAGTLVSDLHPEEWWVQLRDEIYPSILEGKKNWVGEAQLLHVVTRQPIDVLMNVFPVTDPDTGQLVCFAAVMRDITERKRLEEQLRQAQKLESVGQLAGGIAHDFNNLLTVIIGYGELILADMPQTDLLREPVEEIHHAALRASGLTRQLLAFSRRQITEPKVLNLNDLIGNVEKMLRRLIGESIDLTVILEQDCGFLRADPGHMEQVIMNLVINARDAMPTGGRLLIETSRLFVDEDFSHMHLGSAPGENVMLSITDTGVGMTPEVRARIFEPFFTTKETGRGTGLGLSTTYGIVKQSGGTIWVYSEPGNGATFKVLFPAVADPESGDGELHRPAEAEGPLAGSEVVLVAEDEHGVRKYVHQILARNGYTVLEATDGADAIQIVNRRQSPIHLLLTDVVMRDTGGVELAEYFARVRPGIPVIYMSGYNEHLWFREDMTVNLIQKPFSATALLKRVRSLLDLPVGLN
ncbi:MAG TPA: ATP-binding protein [Bryobacteraceae bacterium]|jgi:PAS domain S-box-containing protein|nr:ATP-binding protein [Bryobacteraceae bacterium]